jgi:hypothetical protein
MKCSFLLLFIISTSSSFGLTGKIMVHQAPLFKTPDFNSKVLQWKRKGESIYIYNDQTILKKKYDYFDQKTNIYDVEDDEFDSLEERQFQSEFGDQQSHFEFISDEEFLNLRKKTFEFNEKTWESFRLDLKNQNLKSEVKPSAYRPLNKENDKSTEYGDIDLNDLEMESTPSENDFWQVNQNEDENEDLENSDKASEEKQMLDLITESDLIDLDQSARVHQTENQVSYDKSDFYITLDRNGQTAYIPKDYVKLVTHDEQELAAPLKKLDYDPTDYRLIEPINEHYPFKFDQSYRSYVTFGVGTDAKNSYPYPNNLRGQDYGLKKQLNLVALKKANPELDERLFIGGNFRLTQNQNVFLFTNENEVAKENKLDLSFGPHLLYEGIKYENLVVSAIGGMLVTYHNVSISQKSDTVVQLNKERTFNGFSLGAVLGTLFQWQKIMGNFDFVSEVAFHTSLPYSLKTSSAPDDPSLWQAGEKDVYQSRFDSAFTGAIGLQSQF